MALAELSGTQRRAQPPQDLIREATLLDLPFILALAREKYGAIDADLTAKWIKGALVNPQLKVLRGAHAVGVGYVQDTFYWKKPRGYILFSFSKPHGLSREMLNIMQRLVEWLKGQNCFEVVLGSEIDTDYASFAKLLGAVECPHYVIRFETPCLR